jgi:hypothetical protein
LELIVLTYEQWDAIADSYIPLLALLSLITLISQARVVGAANTWRMLRNLLISIFIAYSIMFLDKQFMLWQNMNSDYSTHTAVALVFVAFLMAVNKSWLVMAPISMVLYCLLMLYQGYHTVLDILSTVVALLPACLVMFLFNRNYKKNHSE